MTTPSNSPEDSAASELPPERAEQPAGPAEQPGPPGPPVPPVPSGQTGPPWVPWQPAAYPFAPVVRAPRTPWVNPARRGHVAAAAIVAALLFGGGGFLIGHAASEHGDHRGVVRIGPGQGLDDHGFGRGQFPRGPGGPGIARPNRPLPSAPATSPSSSPTR